MDLGLENRVVLITGASGGIGRALTDAFAAEGCRLLLHGHSRIDALRQRVEDSGLAERARLFAADVGDAREFDERMREALANWDRIDLCVANAGIWPRETLRLDESPVERVLATVQTNLLGAMWTARSAMRLLRETGPRDDGTGFSLVFIGSTAGRFGEAHHTDYAAAKAGLHGVVMSLKNEIVHLDPFARVNMVQPGWTVTEMARAELETPGVIARVVRTMALRQLARAADIARSVLFLSSPVMARHITGEVVTVAGGMEGRTLWGDGDIDEPAIRARAARRDDET